MKLNKRNTLFPSELKTLHNTIVAYRNRHRVAMKCTDNPVMRQHHQNIIARVDQVIRNKNIKGILGLVKEQYHHLTTWGYAQHEQIQADFIAKKLEVIIPKMEARVLELEIEY